MKLATWNVNSILARLPHVQQWLQAEQPDVLCMQETKCLDEKFPFEAFTELGYCATVLGQRSYNGVAIISREACSNVHRGYADDEAGAHARLLAANVAGVIVVDVYIPNGQAVGSEKFAFKLDWMKRLRDFLDANFSPELPVVLCGDFNVAPEDRDVHDPRLWQGRIMCSQPERDALQRIKEWGFTDAFRLHNEQGGLYSWWDYRAGAFRRNLGLRIDHVWVSQALVARSTGARIDASTRKWEKPSDHAPLIAEFS
ncbi:MAG: exodeoxyribonuclease [Blastocatellia bacterium]|jgi:exodeoxyribonuclease-3|nr:exodeoxyribonuclease [Blastocatellia bacterium]